MLNEKGEWQSFRKRPYIFIPEAIDVSKALRRLVIIASYPSFSL